MADHDIDASIQKVIGNISDIYGRKRVAALALCKAYAETAQQTAQESQGLEQGAGRFWTNRTSLAVKGIRGFTEQSDAYAAWGIKHTMPYGKDLELRNNRERAVLEPTVRELAADFMDEVRSIYAD
jgi:malate synthase